MQLKAPVLEALNAQIKDEFFAAHQYLALAAWFSDRNLPGFAHWFRVQSEEEHGHGLRLFDFVLRRRGTPHIMMIPEPRHEFASPADAVTAAFEHEQAVTAKIHALHSLAADHADRATMVEIDWFVTEQVEEEDSAETLVQRVIMAGDSAPALLILDSQLLERPGATEGA
jgi:ferritin